MKTFLKKILLFAAFALIGCVAVVPTAQAVITRVEGVTPQNIVSYGVCKQIYKLLRTKFITKKIFDSSGNPDQIIIEGQLSHEERKQRAQVIAQSITEDNIPRVFSQVIKELLKADKSTAKIIAQAITKNTIAQVGFYIIAALVDADRSLVATFASYITKDNILQLDFYTIKELLKADKSTAKIIARAITKDNISQVGRYTYTIIKDLLKADNSLVATFASYITKDNISQVGFHIIEALVDADNSLVATFASYITEDNLLQVISHKITDVLIEADKTVAVKIKDLLRKVLPKTDNDLLDIYLYSPKRAQNFMLLLEDNNTVHPKTFNRQLFSTRFVNINQNFYNNLETDSKIRLTLFDVFKNELQEQNKGRYLLYHGRNSGCFIPNQVFLELLELYYSQPIDRNNWYTVHHNIPGTNFAYHKLKKIVKNGRDKNSGTMNGSGPERSYMQFFSDLLGYKLGSSALIYALENRNVDGSKGGHQLKKLFTQFSWRKYYQFGEKEFEQATQLAKKFKYGTLLAYSFTPQALNTFTHATYEGGGYSGPIDLGSTRTSKTQEVLDTLLNNPNKFNEVNRWHEYIMMISDDHPTDKTKLGSANPYNQDIRIKHFNFGDDAKIAEQIKELIKIAFMKIKYAMIKDGVIKKNSPILQSKI